MCGKWKKVGQLIFLFFFCLHFLPACQTGKEDFKPPPKSPQDGYTYDHPKDGVSLVFDAELGVYKVKEYPFCYYSGGYYYQFVDDHWETSESLKNRDWKALKDAPNSLPAGLVKKGPGSGNDENKGKNKDRKKDKKKGKNSS